MTPIPDSTLEARIKRLEQQNRRTKAGALVLLALFTVFLGAGFLSPALIRQEVRTNSLEILDRNGKSSITLDADQFGPALRLWDASGKIRASFGLHPKVGPGLSLYDANGKTRVSLSGSNDGSDLSLYDANGKSRASYYLNEFGPGLTLRDANGKRRASFDLDNEMGPALKLWDAQGLPMKTIP